MRHAFASALLLSAFSVIGLAGCGEESSVTEQTEVQTPEGSQTVTTETTVEKTGDMESDAPTDAAPTTPAP